MPATSTCAPDPDCRWVTSSEETLVSGGAPRLQNEALHPPPITGLAAVPARPGPGGGPATTQRLPESCALAMGAPTQASGRDRGFGSTVLSEEEQTGRFGADDPLRGFGVGSMNALAATRLPSGALSQEDRQVLGRSVSAAPGWDWRPYCGEEGGSEGGSGSSSGGGGDRSSSGSGSGGGSSNELERFRKLASRDSSGEPFRSLEAMLNIADRGNAYITIQRRPWLGVKNYGEVIGFRNRADGDRWDIFVPGLSQELPEGEPLKVRKVIGVVLIKGGNHKLAVELDPPYQAGTKVQVARDIGAFTKSYVKTHPVSSARVKYLALDELDY